MKRYFYIKEENKLGPFDLEDLKSENIKRDTLVWFQGIKDWKKASKIKELGELFIHSPPPVPAVQTKKFRISIQFQLPLNVASRPCYTCKMGVLWLFVKKRFF